METTTFMNRRGETVELNEGHAGSYSLLARVADNKSFDIQVDPDLDVTQQELVVMDHEGVIIAKFPLTDVNTCRKITLTKAPSPALADGSEANGEILKKEPRRSPTVHKPQETSSFLSKLIKFFRGSSGADGSRPAPLDRRPFGSFNRDRASAPARNQDTESHDHRMNSDAQDPE